MHTNIHQILSHVALFYFMLGNLSPMYRSVLSNIHLLCVTKSQALVKYTPEVILESVLNDIQYLEQVYNVYLYTYK